MASHDIYPSLTGAMASWREVEVVAQNISNANSTGFKEHLVSFELQDRGDLPLASSYVQINGEGADLTDGPILQTGVSTHVALQGSGFMMAQAEDGETLLVRSGELRLDNQGFLVTNRGEPIVGVDGLIQVPLDEQIDIAQDGTVTSRRGTGQEVDTTYLGQISLVTAAEVESLGGTRYRAQGEIQPATDTRMIQGALEGSNVDAIGGMIQLIEASRHFEIYQRAMRTSDELDERIQNTVRG